MLSFHFFKCAGKGSFETQPYFSAPETFTFHEAGRSMIEMLAVLVIVGILSITALAGLMSAWAKHKANLIVHDVVLMAVDLIQDHALGSDFIPEADVLYTIDTYDKSFTVTAKNISKRVCKKLLDMNVSPFSDIYINDGNETCGNENDIHFVPSKENLGDVVPCGEKPCVHGRCINNTCQCEDGWIGTYCHLLENGRCGDGTVCDAGEICVNNQCQTCNKEWQTAFCSRYDATGQCTAVDCASAPCTPMSFDTIGVYVSPSRFAYCRSYGTDGKCTNVNTVFYSPYATAYCSSYYSNTTQCQTASVCYGSVTQGNDGKDVCTQ